MCRRNLVVSVALMAFGAGVLLSICIESGLVRFAIAIAALVVGFGLLKKK